MNESLINQALDVCGAEYYYDLQDSKECATDDDLRIIILNGFNVDTIENLKRLDKDTIFEMLEFINNHGE